MLELKKAYLDTVSKCVRTSSDKSVIVRAISQLVTAATRWTGSNKNVGI